MRDAPRPKVTYLVHHGPWPTSKHGLLPIRRDPLKGDGEGRRAAEYADRTADALAARHHCRRQRWRRALPREELPGGGSPAHRRVPSGMGPALGARREAMLEKGDRKETVTLPSPGDGAAAAASPRAPEVPGAQPLAERGSDKHHRRRHRRSPAAKALPDGSCTRRPVGAQVLVTGD
jgi:hypothetical protein